MNNSLGRRPVSTGTLPGDFVLHRAKNKGSLIVSAPKESFDFPNEYEGETLEFDIEIPDDDDFDMIE